MDFATARDKAYEDYGTSCVTFTNYFVGTLMGYADMYPTRPLNICMSDAANAALEISAADALRTVNL